MIRQEDETAVISLAMQDTTVRKTIKLLTTFWSLTDGKHEISVLHLQTKGVLLKISGILWELYDTERS